MCCLFGLIDYQNHFTQKQKNKIISILSAACEARGTDATGIAYNSDNHLRIYKRPFAAHKMRFAIPDNVMTIMGHTRMTTQGNEMLNYNNHPFFGRASNTDFALAHNGVLYNDSTLRITEKLPETKIETDSYIAVQLLEKKRVLDFDSLSYMAKRLAGSFTITVMDREDNIYFIKGDNPMCIYHCPDIGVYIYASTEEILKKAIKKIPYRFGAAVKVDLTCGEIMKIDRHGDMKTVMFDTELLYACNYYPYSFDYHHSAKSRSPQTKEYIHELKKYANFYGYNDDIVDMLLEDGYSTDEIEDMLYCSIC